MTLYFALSGQSNALSHAAPSIAFTPSSQLMVWNNADNLNDLTSLGNAWVTPDLSQPPSVSGWDCHGYRAADLIARCTGQDVRLVKVARGGQAIGQWYQNTARGPMLNRLTAVLAAAGVSALSGLWWDQGQADEADTSRYLDRFDAMIGCLVSDGFLATTTPIVAVEQPNLYPKANAALASITARDVTRYGLAPVARMVTQSSSPDHWTAPELLRMAPVVAGLQMLLAA